MKLAIAYSTKDEVENTTQTADVLLKTWPDKFVFYWIDGSSTEEGKRFHRRYNFQCFRGGVHGGADAAIAYKLSHLLAAEEKYTHIGLLENDVLLDEDWFEPTMQLFEKGKQDGLEVGAVSARSYVDRVLIQRDGYAVMHNLGAGMVVFTREAAEIVLRTFRTHWWPDNVKLFAQLSGIDLRTYAAFRGNEQMVTTDWGWEAQLARYGLASLALTPAKCSMIGQVPPLHEQGLELTQGPVEVRRDNGAFTHYRDNLYQIRQRGWEYKKPVGLYREGDSTLFFPHQLGPLDSEWRGTLELKWSQGFGPFAYRAGPGGASLAVHVSGNVHFLLAGGEHGSSVQIEDHRSGFKFAPPLPPMMETWGTITVPGGPVPRMVTLDLREGAVLYGMRCDDPQLIDTTWRFDWTQLPPAAT